MQAQLTSTLILLELIAPSPHNPRKLFEEDGLKELAESIKKVGLLEPIVVRPLEKGKAKFEIIAGERRWRASKMAGLESISATVRECDDKLALEIAVIENMQRRDLTVGEEVNGVASLIESGLSHQDVADRIGRGVEWVARRAKLKNLIPEIRKLAENGEHQVSQWPIRYLEVIAALEPSAQAIMFERHKEWFGKDAYRKPDAYSVSAALASFVQRLDTAPWKLDDQTINAKAGACNDCKKRTSCQQGLFDDDDFNGDEFRRPTKVQKTGDRCLDKTCWDIKMRAAVEAKIEKLKEENGGVVLLGDPKQFKGARQTHEFQHVSENTKGAKVAIDVETGEISHVKPWSGNDAGEFEDDDGEGEKGKAKKDAPIGDRFKALAAKRGAHCVRSLIDTLLRAKHFDPKLWDEPGPMLDLVRCFGTHGKSSGNYGWLDDTDPCAKAYSSDDPEELPPSNDSDDESDEMSPWDRLKKIKPKDTIRAVAISVGRVHAARLKWFGGVEKAPVEEAMKVAKCWSIEWSDLWTKACEECRVPKSRIWAGMKLKARRSIDGEFFNLEVMSVKDYQAQDLSAGGGIVLLNSLLFDLQPVGNPTKPTKDKPKKAPKAEKLEAAEKAAPKAKVKGKPKKKAKKTGGKKGKK